MSQYGNKLRKINTLLWESVASDQAKDLGLEYAGYSKWKDPKTGVVVAKTIGKHLVRIDPKKGANDTELDSHNQWKSYLPNEDERMTQPRDPWELHRKAYFDTHDDLLNAYFPEEYDLPDVENVTWEFKSIMKRRVTKDMIAKEFAHVMNVNPNVEYVHDSYNCNNYAKVFNTKSGANAFYQPTTKKIEFSTTVTNRLNLIEELTYDDVMSTIKSYQKSYKSMEPFDESEKCKKTVEFLRGVHTMIHEMVHSKDRSLEKNNYIGSSPTGVFILEGLTDYKAREILQNMLVGNAKSLDNKNIRMFINRGYDREVAGMERLESIAPGITNTLWKAPDDKAREQLITKVLQTAMQAKINKTAREKGLTEDDVAEIATVIDSACSDEYGYINLLRDDLFSGLYSALTFGKNRNEIITRINKKIEDWKMFMNGGITVE